VATEQLFQIGIKAVIQNEKGEILLLAVPQWGDNPAHWDFPGGRMEPGETFEQTLRRELQEEIGITYEGAAEHMATVLSNITIPVGDMRVPLVLMPYRVLLPAGAVITLDPNGPEQEYEWCNPAVAAERLLRKYPPEFCEKVTQLEV
jgi:8-oxo-dGTP pyrophosphatase MutT (NUDIX family)